MEVLFFQMEILFFRRQKDHIKQTSQTIIVQPKNKFSKEIISQLECFLLKPIIAGNMYNINNNIVTKIDPPLAPSM